MAEKTVRKYYALHWKPHYEFNYDYNTILKLDAWVATVVSFNKKRDRDKYVDRWHSAESIPASIAHKLIKQIGVKYYNSEV